MTYRLIIVDDEEHIREGLSDLVDWTSLGFEVVAKLEDGIQALDLLQKKEIDIILSDVKMTHLSGLELAKHVHENYPKTKMVLISGFKEFDFVKQAMTYNVINYLLKPTKLGDIRSVFQDVKNRLDKEKEEQAQISKVIKHNNELLPLIRKQLFRDMATGKLHESLEVEKLLKLTEVRANTSQNRCALVRVCFTNAGSEEDIAVDAVEKIFRNESAGILYVPIMMNSDQLNIVAIDLQQRNDVASFSTSIQSYMQSAVLRMHTLLGLEAKAEIVEVFDHLQELMDAKTAHITMDNNLLDEELTKISIKAHPQLAEQRKQFLAYVSVGNFEALPGLFDALLNTVKQEDLPSHFAKNLLVELFSSLCSKLSEMDMSIDKITAKPFYYETILRLNSYSEWISWGLPLLNEISDYVQKMTSTEPSMIQKAKEYVANFYDKDITLESAASQVYLSPDYFGRLFKQYTGNSFTDFVAEYRINKALEHLQDPQFKIYEIGSIVGYKNTKYFFKLFKKHTGYTPTEYRRKSIPKDKL